MKSTKDFQKDFDVAVELMISKPDGKVFSKSVKGGLPRCSVGKLGGNHFTEYLHPGYNIPGEKGVVFWFYPNGDNISRGKARIEMKIDCDMGMKLIEPAIYCDDVIRRIQAYTELENVL